MTLSIIMPAHNEASVIRRSLETLLDGAAADELELIVVCNGCRDDTALIARSLGPSITVIETDVPSKANALNLGDAAAKSYPRIYMDADVIMSIASVRALSAPLMAGTVLAAAPAVNTVFKADADWSVRAYYKFWMALPFIKEGMMAAGVYALSEAGRRKFDRFPDIISDDGFVRLHFAPDERIEVAEAVSTVVAPSRWADLIRIKSRSRLGTYQLQDRFAGLYADEKRTKRYGSALASILRTPSLYICAIPFLAISVISRARAQKQHRSATPYQWERDQSSRAAS